MVRKADLLFGDVELFEVEDHLLLQPVAVHVGLQLFEVVQNPGLDRLRAGLFERHYLFLVAFDPVHAAEQVGDQDGAFLHAECVEPGGGGFRRGDQRRMLLVGYALRLGRYHFGQTHDDGHDGVVVGVDAREGQRVGHLAQVFAEHLFIYTRRRLHGLRLDGHEDIDLAALDRAGDDIAYFVFLP